VCRPRMRTALIPLPEGLASLRNSADLTRSRASRCRVNPGRSDAGPADATRRCAGVSRRRRPMRVTRTDTRTSAMRVNRRRGGTDPTADWARRAQAQLGRGTRDDLITQNTQARPSRWRRNFPEGRHWRCVGTPEATTACVDREQRPPMGPSPMSWMPSSSKTTSRCKAPPRSSRPAFRLPPRRRPRLGLSLSREARTVEVGASLSPERWRGAALERDGSLLTQSGRWVPPWRGQGSRSRVTVLGCRTPTTWSAWCTTGGSAVSHSTRTARWRTTSAPAVALSSSREPGPHEPKRITPVPRRPALPGHGALTGRQVPRTSSVVPVHDRLATPRRLAAGM